METNFRLDLSKNQWSPLFYDFAQNFKLFDVTKVKTNALTFLSSAFNILKSLSYDFYPLLCLFLVDYVDVDYSLWLSWLLMPLLISFLLPVIIVVLFYTSAIIFHICKLYRNDLMGSTSMDWREKGIKITAAIWDAHGWLWHGYEIEEMETVPNDPVLFIFYHGALPVDMYYFLAKINLYRNIIIHTVADRLLFKIPGWSIFLDSVNVIPGTVQTCVGVLKEGNQLAIAPGGVYEAQFGSEYYKLLWKQRRGYVKVALEAKVPIIPVFTQNLREAFRTVGLLRRVFLWIYSVTRVPLAPVYGGFPVKLITYLGEPILPDPSLTPDQLHSKVMQAMETLIDKHQRIPGSITRGIIERIYRVPKTKKLPPAIAPPLINNISNNESKIIDKNEENEVKLTEELENKENSTSNCLIEDKTNRINSELMQNNYKNKDS